LVAVLLGFLATLILALDGPVRGTGDKSGAVGLVGPALSVGALVGGVTGTGDNGLAQLQGLNAVSLGTFDWLFLGAGRSGAALVLVFDALSVPTVELALPADFDHAGVFGGGAGVIRTSHGVEGTGVDGRTHKYARGAFASGTNYLVAARPAQRLRGI